MSASVSVEETTYFCVSLKNGAPGSSSSVRLDHAGSNISYVVRPSRMARERLGDGGDRLAHLRVEAEVERPGRRVDDAVERHELVDEDLAHQNPYRSSCQGSASLW